MRLTHEIDVLAPLDLLWTLTEDVGAWPSITPTMTAVEPDAAGPPTAGWSARVTQPRQRPTTWTVRAVEPPHLLVWETTVAGARLVAGHALGEAEGGTRLQLVLDVLGRTGPALGRLAGPAMRRALATEADGFRRAAERLDRPAYVDEHTTDLDVPAVRAWDTVRSYAEELAARPGDGRLESVLATDPPAGFAVADEVSGRLLSLAGSHRFSRYVLDLRVDPTADGSRVTAITYADFPGPRGRAYRAAVVGSRGHVLAVRRMLAAIGERA